MRNTNFGKNFKKLREKESVTQEVLAMRLHVDKSTISHWEHSRRMPDDEMLKSIAEYFEISVEELFDDINEEYKDTRNEEVEEATSYYNFIDCPLPRIDVEKTRAYIVFKEALRLDKKIIAGNYTPDEVVDMAHKYWEAFDYGILGAGVNLLAHLFRLVLHAKSAGEEEHGLDNKIKNLIEGLQLYGHQAGDYYEALWLMSGLNGNGNGRDENFDNGLTRLYELADEENEYAIAFAEWFESADEGTSAEELVLCQDLVQVKMRFSSS